MTRLPLLAMPDSLICHTLKYIQITTKCIKDASQRRSLDKNANESHSETLLFTYNAENQKSCYCRAQASTRSSCTPVSLVGTRSGPQLGEEPGGGTGSHVAVP